jgi:hypothetical protein
MVKNSFLRKGFKKDNKTEYIIGCSLDFLRNHLESKFEPWMTWDNKGLYNGELNYGWDIVILYHYPLQKQRMIL